MGKIFKALEKAGQGEPAIPKPKKPPAKPQKPIAAIEQRSPATKPKTNGDAQLKVLKMEAASRRISEAKLSSHLITYHKPGSLEAEMFKQLRTKLLFPSEGKPPRSIMVTSATPGEGKSFVSANLAISIARGVEEHVLLMDCDMRNASIHGLFGHDTTPGLSDYLSHGTPIPSLLMKTPISKLTLLPGGPTPNNPTELLSSQQMSDLLQEVKERYVDRYIIIDSPPPKLTAETSALARQVDGIILVIKAKKTPKKLVEEVTEVVGKEKILGVVLNWYDTALPRYSGYGNYGKYYHKEK